MRPLVAHTVALAFALTLGLVAPQVAAQSAARGADAAEDRITATIDWSTRTLTVTVERHVDAAARGPAAISRTQRAIRRDAPGIILDYLVRVAYDSSETIATLLDTRPALIGDLEAAAADARVLRSSSSADLQAARVTFAVDLYGRLAQAFITAERPLDIEARLGWVPTTGYTGILIYAADRLPVFGTTTNALAEPSLFPRFYYITEPDGLLYRLAEMDHVDTEQLTRGGPVSYTSDVVPLDPEGRIGSRPLRILAVGLFGDHPTDIVLREADALQIMASAHNRALVREGRVVVIVDRSVVQKDL